MDIHNYLWVAKYRPKQLEDIILNNTIKSAIKGFIVQNNMPHCMFIGKPGTGKTSLALILMNHFTNNNNDRLFLNASDDRGIQSMRDIVIEFMKTPPYSSRYKIVVMDECDNLTNDAWLIIRNPIENEQTNPDYLTRFIFTANYANKVPDFMKSRCAVFEFSSIPKDAMMSKVKNILKNENISYNEEELSNLIDYYYPDFRAVINNLQSLCIDNKFSFSSTLASIHSMAEILLDTIESTNVSHIKQNITQIRNIVHTTDINPVEVIRYVLNEKDVSLPTYIVLNRYLNTFNNVLDKNAHFIAMIYECILFNQKCGKLSCKS